ncbi:MULTISPECIES: hypothetical protein [Providencia]|uniref:Uncharacterized protein n=1 Tax=Providencia rettgeri TaxID=587 RepID=A0AB35LBH6_PRORE|nr:MULTISPECIES: hypothetical protein [Providencia]MBO8254697.1 hypothetical protein [Providencia rettgeri]MBO8258437.1 hypothetical protein [Providencia rettgeri]MDE4731014.1 hypothetical protein [Providencia rettgeri]MDH2305685.1 hypothetical protein [Providencia rettgeri]
MEQQLIDALKESVNFLTLAVFSFIACFAMYRTKNERKRNNVKTRWWDIAIFWFYTILFLILGAGSIALIVREFMQNSASGGVIGIVGFIAVLVIVNAATVVFGVLEFFDKKEEENMGMPEKLDDSIAQLLSTDKYSVTWLMQMESNNVVFSRIVNGKVDESYVPVSYDKANVYAASILNGLQPPKHLYLSDKRIG